MFRELREQFEMGFSEGWSAFWSPFVGLYRALKANLEQHSTESPRRH